MLFGAFAFSPAAAAEKIGMPDLSQVEQTCLPTATANLIIWFGRHGYPKLLAPGATTDERELRTVHGIMRDTDARFDFGTRMDEVTVGIGKYIREAGYSCDIEYRGIDGAGPDFSQEWLQQNDDARHGFILVLAYCHWDPQTRTATPVLGTGHAVTLVNARPDMLLVHDPAHQDDETGRKILTPEPIAQGTWKDADGFQSLAGMLFLSGSLLDAPDNSRVLLLGAVCVRMHPLDQESPASASGLPPSATTIGRVEPDAVPPAPANPTPAPWWDRMIRFLF